MTPATLRIAQLEKQLRDSRSLVDRISRQRDDAIMAAERTRKARVKPITPGVVRHRHSDDLIRFFVPDTHGAKIDKLAAAAVIADIKLLQPDEIYLLGDHVDCGGFLALHHVMGYVAETEYSYDDDVAAATAFLDAIQKAAPRAKIVYIEGNHERRVETWCVTQTLRNRKDAEMLRKQFAPEFMLRLDDRGIEYIRQGVFYDGLSVPGVIKRGKCFVFHGISTSKNAVASTIVRLAGNCVFAHTHRAQAVISRTVGTGVIGSWNPGCLCELQPLWQHTAPTEWSHGYGIQLVRPSGSFIHLNIPIFDGESHLASLFKL